MDRYQDMKGINVRLALHLAHQQVY